MAGIHLGTALRQVQRLFDTGTVAGLSDRQLLDRYLEHRDESAFEALLMRYGPMVLGVCQAILRGAPEVEDAFQATFLVLIRKAGTIRGHDTVGGWLHRVARRVAVQAGRERQQTHRTECRVNADSGIEPACAASTDDDWQAALHEELARLPARLRRPVVLCYLEGRTHARAAFDLRCSEATLRRRLAAARNLLRARLTRRGLAVSGAVLAASLTPRATAAVPPGWVAALSRAAAGRSAGQVVTGPAISTAATHLAEIVARSLVAAQIRTLANIVTLLFAASLVAPHLVPLGPARAGDPAGAAAAPAPAAPRPVAFQPRAEPSSSFVIGGRVLDPDGQPFAGARVYAYRPDPRPGDEFFAADPPAPDAISDADGRFRFAIADPGSSALQDAWRRPTVAALAAGYGPAWAEFASAEEARGLTLKLAKDDVPILGRILDLEGRPVPGVTVRPIVLTAPSGEDLSAWEAMMAEAKSDSDGRINQLSRRPDLEFFRWRKDFTATTDAGGRFRMTGIGRERIVSLWIEGPTIATDFVNVSARTRPGPTFRITLAKDRPEFGTHAYYGSTFDHAASPTRPIEGSVRDKDTGRPLAGISIRSDRFAGNPISGRDYVRTTTGADGRYRLVGMPPGAGNRITANPGVAQPYLGASAEVPGGAGPGPATVDFALKHGVAIRGKVRNKATGQPVPAVVEYFVLIDNPHRREARGLHGRELRTGADGSFALVGLPGRGLVTARALEDRYLTGQGAERIAAGDANGFRTDPHICQPDLTHAIVAIEPGEDARSLDCDLALDPGKERAGTLIGPDGRSVSGCEAIHLRPPTMSYHTVKLASGEFTALALDPKQSRPLFFRHGERHLAAVAMVKGDESTPLTVRLQPAGTVTGRLVDDLGEPRRGLKMNVRHAEGQFGPRYFSATLDPTIGDDGRFRIEGLIPGVAYDIGTVFGSSTFLGDFATGVELQPGETRDLGDVTIKMPR